MQAAPTRDGEVLVAVVVQQPPALVPAPALVYHLLLPAAATHAALVRVTAATDTAPLLGHARMP